MALRTKNKAGPEVDETPFDRLARVQAQLVELRSEQDAALVEVEQRADDVDLDQLVTDLAAEQTQRAARIELLEAMVKPLRRRVIEYRLAQAEAAWVAQRDACGVAQEAFEKVDEALRQVRADHAVAERLYDTAITLQTQLSLERDGVRRELDAFDPAPLPEGVHRRYDGRLVRRDGTRFVAGDL